MNQTVLATFLLLIFSVAARDEEILQTLGPNIDYDGVLRSLRSSDPPLDVRTNGLLRSLRSDQDLSDEVHRDAMMRSLRSFPPAFFAERKLQDSRYKKFLQFLSLGEK